MGTYSNSSNGKQPGAGNLYGGGGRLSRKPTHKVTVSKRTKTSGKGHEVASHSNRHTGGAKAPSAPPVDPLDAQVRALVQERYGGQEAALAQRQASIAPWFHQFQVEEAARAAQQQGVYQGLQLANQQAMTQAAQGPNLGPGVSADVQAQSQQAGAARQNLQGMFGQTVNAAGAAENSYLGGLASSANAAQVTAQLQASRDQSQLAADKGAYSTQARTDIQDAQDKAALEQQVFGLNVQKEQDTVANQQQQSKDKASQRRSTSRNQRASQRSSAEQRAADRTSREKIAQQKQQTADAKAHGKVQQAHRKTSNKALDRLDSITHDLKSATSNPDQVTVDKGLPTQHNRPASREEAIAKLRADGFSANEIHLALKSEWDDADVRMAHRLGIIVADSGRKRKLKTPKGQRPDTAGNPNVSPSYKP